MSAHDWYPDALGEDFHARTFALGEDPDGEGEVQAILVRYRPDDAADWTQRPAMLMVHGMTDYFFHQHIAHRFHDEGFAVYGIDLRKSGRAHITGQRWHYVSDLKLYFAELEATCTYLAQTHGQVIPIAHSTGGLIVPLWLDELRTLEHPLHRHIPALILNSPWLDMQFPPRMVKALRRLLHSRAGEKILGKGFGGKMPSNYGRSLHSSQGGDWDYELAFKPLEGHPKYPDWLRSVDSHQQRIHAGAVDVDMPILTLHSSDSWFRPKFTRTAKRADTVLDVRQIARRAPLLGQDVTLVSIEGAVHDVFLSEPAAREQAVDVCLEWLAELDLP